MPNKIIVFTVAMSLPLVASAGDIADTQVETETVSITRMVAYDDDQLFQLTIETTRTYTLEQVLDSDGEGYDSTVFNTSTINSLAYYDPSDSADYLDRAIYAHDWQQKKLVRWNVYDDSVEVLDKISDNSNICGLAFNDEGELYGIDNRKQTNKKNSRMIQFNLDDGSLESSSSLKEDGSDFRLKDCGMTYNSDEEQFIGVNLNTKSDKAELFSVTTEGEIDIVLEDLDDYIDVSDWDNIGIEYDSGEGVYYISTGIDGDSTDKPFFRLEQLDDGTWTAFEVLAMPDNADGNELDNLTVVPAGFDNFMMTNRF